jgi:beta-glucosidase
MTAIPRQIGAQAGLQDGFLWGAATAAHQIEGGNTNSDWWMAEHSGAPHIQEPSGDACDSYHRYRDDIRLLAEVGLNAYRFSMEWARIEPAEGEISKAQLLHSRAMIDTCHEFGVAPVVTLHHFTFPRWLAESGGLRRPDIVERFTHYADACCGVLHDVEWVVTINEPNMAAQMVAFAKLAEERGIEGLDLSHPPMPDPTAALLLQQMHRAAVPILRERTSAKVGWAIAAQAFTPTPGNEAVWQDVFQQWEGQFYEASAGDDFIGVQSYTSQPVGPDGPEPHPEHPANTLTGWAYRPDALGLNLSRIWDRYGIPLFVTENGIATDDDERRIAYTREALKGMFAAVADGADVRGYCHWSLLDNYEWGSFRPTFGLISVDRGADFARHPKPSLAWLGEVARSSGRLIQSDERGADL